ncbi:hypothetical protein [Ichthyobacterium seriolicida]|uniref:hypothetical protein n=1 Tax=Ichthyobacterium seriolicida TaxID=242600 RepID=UPI0012FE4671|nr:hypothetical protein [Ichthyobacterium seriolicida]
MKSIVNNYFNRAVLTFIAACLFSCNQEKNILNKKSSYSPNREKEILSFYFKKEDNKTNLVSRIGNYDIEGKRVTDNQQNYIYAVFPSGMNIGSASDRTLVPTVVISDKSNVSPADNEPKEFFKVNDPQIYTVEAEDKSTKSYKILALKFPVAFSSSGTSIPTEKNSFTTKDIEATTVDNFNEIITFGDPTNPILPHDTLDTITINGIVFSKTPNGIKETDITIFPKDILFTKKGDKKNNANKYVGDIIVTSIIRNTSFSRKYTLELYKKTLPPPLPTLPESSDATKVQ